MCRKCDEMREAFQNAETVIDREVLWKAFDAQRRECENPKKKEKK